MAAEKCLLCQDAVELDQAAIVLFGGAELAVLACDRHLRRLVLAIEVLEALEACEHFVIPPLVDVAFQVRLGAAPERRP